MENANELYEKRMKICKECPLYLESPMGPRCNSKLYINETDKISVSDRPKIGYKRGCNCLLNRRNLLPNARCVVSKW